MSPSSPSVQGVHTLPCPHCGTPTVYARDNPARPFCSQRCRNLDFGAWAQESFRVSDCEDEIGFEPKPGSHLTQ